MYEYLLYTQYCLQNFIFVFVIYESNERSRWTKPLHVYVGYLVGQEGVVLLV